MYTVAEIPLNDPFFASIQMWVFVCAAFFQGADRSSKHFPWRVVWLAVGLGSVVIAVLLLLVFLGILIILIFIMAYPWTWVIATQFFSILFYQGMYCWRRDRMEKHVITKPWTKIKQNLIEYNFLNKKYLAQTILYIKLDQQNLYSFFLIKKTF